jgi:ABC transporter with metal-binding/Fe-S-binding domain ATP-binding protein
MKLLGLFSGGKDSTFALYKAKMEGHEVSCLLTMCPDSDSSLLFHYPNCKVANSLGEAMNIPSILFGSKSGTKEEETQYLEKALVLAMSHHKVEGVVHGTIASRYQKQVFEQVCRRLNLEEISPLWQVEQPNYIDLLIEQKFEIMIVGVSAMGLDQSWLGKILDPMSLTSLKRVCGRYRINITFEGGEAETLVVDCPIYSKKLGITSAKISWDGQRGIFEIQDAALVQK